MLLLIISVYIRTFKGYLGFYIDIYVYKKTYV